MRQLKSKIIYHGGTLPVPSYRQKGEIRLEKEHLVITAKGQESRYDVAVQIPLNDVISVRAVENKYYSSVAYCLEIAYRTRDNSQEHLELEIRSFVRRGRAQAIARWWAETFAPQPTDRSM